MTSDERQLKYLEWIQSIIARQAANSFLLKGWSVTLLAGLFALSLQSNDRHLLWLACLPVLAFGLLDAYYLHQEKRYVALFNFVQRGQISETQIRDHGPFCLAPNLLVSSLPSFGAALKSPSIWGFHGALLMVSVWLPLSSVPSTPQAEQVNLQKPASTTIPMPDVPDTAQP